MPVSQVLCSHIKNFLIKWPKTSKIPISFLNQRSNEKLQAKIKQNSTSPTFLVNIVVRQTVQHLISSADYVSSGAKKTIKLRKNIFWSLAKPLNSLRPSDAHICISNLTIIGSDNGLSLGQCQAITWTNVCILLIGPLGTDFSGMLIKIHTFSFKKIHVKMSSGKWWPFCLGPNVLNKH